MATFSFTARDKTGKVISDLIEASDRDAAGQYLRGQGLLPTLIVEKRTFSWNLSSVANRLGHVSMLEKLTLISNLAVTIRAGLPVSRALQVLTKQMPNPYLQKALNAVSHAVEGGKTLSDSMAEFPRVFSPIAVNMVKVGEQSGELDKNLEYLGAQISRDYNLLRQTRGALIYPAVVAVALLIIGYLMFTFVLPKLTDTFKEFDVELPLLTVTIIKVVDIFSRYSIFVAISFLLLAMVFWYWHKTQSGRFVVHRVSLALPIIGNIVRKVNLARFSLIFGGLLRSGMPIVEALKVTGNTMNNLHYQRAVTDASEKVKIGIDLVVALEKYPKLFAPMVTQMIQVGEESGTMEKVLSEVASFYETEVTDTVKNLSSIIEPVLVMVIGAVVGVLAVGLIMPIYNITQNI